MSAAIDGGRPLPDLDPPLTKFERRGKTKFDADIHAVETVGGNLAFNRFDIPQLRGINQTAPYFHDHRAKTLEDVVLHYQSFFLFINKVRGFPLPLIPDEDVAPIVAYMKRAF